MSKARHSATSRARGKTCAGPDGVSSEQSEAKGLPYSSVATFDDETVRRMCAEHETGVFWKHCLDAEGLSESGWHEAKARRPDFERWQRAAKARGVAKLRRELDSLVEAGMRGEWKSKAWFLERFDREAFTPPTAKVESKTEVTGKDGAPLVAPVPTTMAERRAKLLEDARAIAETEADLAALLAAAEVKT